MSQAVKSTCERPWQSEVPPLEESVEIVEKYPSDEEENGMVVVAWRGPLAKVTTVVFFFALCIELKLVQAKSNMVVDHHSMVCTDIRMMQCLIESRFNCWKVVRHGAGIRGMM